MKTLLLLLVFSQAALAQQESTPTFPSDGEVLQLLDHLDALTTVFKGSIAEQESKIQRDYRDDKKLVADIQQVSATLRKNPQGFNSAAGYLAVRQLFGIVLSEGVCSSEALMQSNAALFMVGNTEKASTYTKLSTACSQVAIFSKAVMDTADNLYSRSVLANDELRKKSIDVAMKCGEALKMSEAARKKAAH